MKTQKVMNMLMAIYECLTEHQKELADAAMNGKFFNDALHNVSTDFHKAAINYSAEMALGEAIRATKCEMIEEEVNKPRATRRRGAIKRVLKKGAASKPIYAFTEIIDGKQYFLNPYVAYCLTTICEGLPVREHDSESFDFIRNFTGWTDGRVHELELPTLTELKLIVKKKKASEKSYEADHPTYDFGEGKPMVKLEFLIELREIMPKARLYWDGHEKKAPGKDEYYFHSLYATDDEGNEAIIMPVTKRCK